MADNSNDPTMQNQDVIQAARGIRSNPALFAALMSPPTAAPAGGVANPTVGSAVMPERPSTWPWRCNTRELRIFERPRCAPKEHVRL